MKRADDRTPAERTTHPILIVGTDSFMSGWGKAEGGTSYAAWACRQEDERAVLEWVERRGDMKRVRVTFDLPSAPYRPKGRGHLHIYVVREDHPALESKRRMAALARV